MCNIAGYIGKRQAAPILIEMMRREEGFAAGYYTGMTVHDGTRLVTDKVLGGLDRLLAETDCQRFLGTCGFIHSRSKSGGGREWGQPFLSADGCTSLIANGMAGVFLTPEMKEKRCKYAASLEELGYTFPSRAPGTIGDYPALSDGTAIHSTDLMCQYVTSLIDGGMPIGDALTAMMNELPCEVVTLLMRKEAPDSIFVSRINFPMTVGIAADGDIYLATTRLAFPEDVDFKEIRLLPAAATYEFRRGAGIPEGAPLSLPREVTAITEELIEEALPLFVDRLRALNGEPTLAGPLLSSYASIWPKDKLNQEEPMFYELCTRLEAEGRLGIATMLLEGAAPGYTATRFGVYLKEA